MSLVDEYRSQFAWRDWAKAFAVLPELGDQLVLDLGCGPGDQAAELVRRGARVLGIDGNEELLEAARARGLPRAEFRAGDLRALAGLGVGADGIWCSFAAAYFTDLASVLAAWARLLRPGGWIALTEVDDFFAHEPLDASTRTCFESYAAEALAARRYDFRMGAKLAEHLLEAGFTSPETHVLADQEFAFDGPARPEVLAAWHRRLERMSLLKQACGSDFEAVRGDFLACLAHPEHRSRARVVFCLARK